MNIEFSTADKIQHNCACVPCKKCKIKRICNYLSSPPWELSTTQIMQEMNLYSLKTKLLPEHTKAIRKIVLDWDLNKTVCRASEEFLELSLSLLHFARRKAKREDVLNKMADVRIALEHLEIKFGNYQKQLNKKYKKGGE